MSGWMILALILLVLLLIGQVRVGAVAEYSQAGPEVRVRLGPVRLKVFPLAKKEKTQEQLKKEAEKKARAEEKKKAKKEQKKSKAQQEKKSLQEKVGGGLDLARELLPLALEAAGCFWNKLIVDELELCLTVGGPDPADAAMLYGQANAALGALWQPLTQAFHVKNGHAHVAIDFDAQSMTLYGKAALSLKIGQIVWLGVHFGCKALAGFLRYRKITKTKEQARKAV